MAEEKALNVGPTGIEVAYERLGDAQAPPVLLVQGVAAQMINWPDGFCAELPAHAGQAIRFDNRDVGLSSHFPDAPHPTCRPRWPGTSPRCFYTLSDMATPSGCSTHSDWTARTSSACRWAATLPRRSRSSIPTGSGH